MNGETRLSNKRGQQVILLLQLGVLLRITHDFGKEERLSGGVYDGKADSAGLPVRPPDLQKG